MTTINEINRAIIEATVDRANRDVNTGEVIWEYVVEDVKYFFRDEIAESANVEVMIASELFAFRNKYKETA